MIMIKKRVISLALMLLIIGGSVCQAGNNHIYSTWDVLELDSCASAWLIKTFVDKQAEFKFYPKGDLITEGEAFDTPDAKMKRTQRKSTFENMLDEYKIKDPALEKIAQMIHVVEIDFWACEPDAQTRQLKEKIIMIGKEVKDPHEILERSFMVMDELYDSLKVKAK